MNEKQPKFETVRQTPYGPEIRRVDHDEEGLEPVSESRFLVESPDINLGSNLESSNDEKFDDSDTEPSFEVIPGSNIGYGPSIARKKEIVDSNEILTSAEEKKSLRQLIGETAEQYGLNFEAFSLNENQRKQLRAVLIAVGVAVTPVDSLHKHFSKSDKYTAVASTGEIFSGSENSVIEKSNAFNEASGAEVVDTPEVFKEGKVTETPKVYRESEPMDAFEKEIAKYNALLDSDYVKVIEQHADKPVIGAEEYTRLKYVQEEIQFAKWDPEKGTGIPPVVEEELRKILPGLCAQESRFDNGLTSETGAKGIMQFMPETWAMYGGKPGEHASLKKQVEIAGMFFSDLYKQVQHHVGSESLQKLRSHYTDEDSFQRDLMVPLMINSYNVGASRMAEAVQLYLARTPVKKMPTGKELYIAIADFAKSSKGGEYLSGYGEASREYVPRIYAQAEILNKKKKGNKRV